MIRKSVILVVLTLVLAGCGVYSFRGALVNHSRWLGTL